jgi:hypothetical protein
MLYVMALEDHGVQPSDGEVLVTAQPAENIVSPWPCWQNWAAKVVIAVRAQ